MIPALFIMYIFKIYKTVGTIKGFGDVPIVQTISNISETADYTFNFILESKLDIEGYVEIEFPKEFSSTISLSTLCSTTCTAITITYKLYFDNILYPQIRYSATIYNIQNPIQLVGIGNFVLRTKKGANIIDESFLMGSAGTATAISLLISTSVSIDGSASYAGELTKYIFSFKTTISLPINIEMMIVLPADTFEVSTYPSCSTFPINDEEIKATLICEYVDDKIYIRGFEQDMPKGSMVGIRLTMRNPRFSTVTSDFAFYIYKLNTSSVLARKEGIKGVSITAGKISQVSLQPLDNLYTITKSKLMWSKLTFKVKNPLLYGSYIEINLPVNFNIYDTPATVLGTPWSYYLFKGLNDSTVSVKITKTTVNGADRLKITDFGVNKNQGEIVVVFLATSPNSAGKTSALEIKSFLSNGSEIDNNVTDAVIRIEDVPTPLSLAVVSSVTSVDGKSLVNLNFTIIFGRGIQAGSTIRLLFDESLTVNSVSATNCKMFDTVNGLLVNAARCYRTDRYVYIVTSQDFELGISKPLNLLSIIKSPKYAGRYFVEVNVYDVSSVLVQSTTVILTFNPKPLDNPNIGVYPKQLNQKSMFDVSFTSPYELAYSLPDSVYTDSVSFIELEFENVNDPSLGLGLSIGTIAAIPCKSTFGLVPYTGNTITCSIEVATNPKIRIINYQSVDANELLSFLIPKILNPTTAWQLYIRLVAKKNRLLTLLSESVLNMTTDTPVPMGLDTVVLNSPDTFYTVSNKNIGSLFNVNFKIISTNQIQTYSKVIITLPSYGDGLLTTESYPTCSILNKYFRCYHFSDIDWMYIEIDNNVLDPLATSLISLKNLKWPLYVPTVLPSVYNIFTFIDSTAMIANIMLYPPLPRTDQGSIIYYHINLTNKSRSAVDCTYKFLFTLNVDVPSGSSIVITFPSVYNLLAPFPSIYIESPELTELSGGLATFSFTSFQVTIANLGFIPKDYPFSIIANGISNPNTTSTLTTWDVQIAYNGNKIAEVFSFFSFKLFDEYSPGRVFIENIDVFPNNKDVLAEYTFKFSLQRSLRSGARIFITFPSEYVTIPNSPSCFVAGGLTTFKNCKKQLNSIYIELDQRYVSGVIQLKITDIRNLNVDYSNPFYIYSYYDSKLIDETKSDSESFLKVHFSPSPGLIKVKEFIYEPINQAMVADYTITFQPSNSILSDMLIVIDFPATFDRKLGNNVDIVVEKGLEGNMEFTIDSARLYIKGFDVYNVLTQEQIKLTIKGVMNPNKIAAGNNGYVSVGTLKADGSEYQDYLENFGLVETSNSPLPLEIRSIVPSNTLARIKANYTFNLNIPVQVKESSLGGQVLVYLPDEFENNDEKIPCEIENMELDCYWKYKIITIKGHTNKLTGLVSLTLKDVINPLEEVTTGSIHVSTYDSYNKEVTSKSYPNLNYLNFTYKFPGPLLIINDNQPIYIERGTQSKDTNFIMTDISALDLTIVGSSTAINIVRESIKLNIGENMKKIRFSVPMEIPEGEYYVDWTTQGDQNPPIYTPIKRTKIIVSQKKGVPLKVDEISDIPKGGSSLAVKLHTDFAPDMGFEIILNLSSSITAVATNTTIVSFEAGQNTAYFSINYSDDIDTIAQSGIIDLELKGVNQEIYSLEKTSMTYNLISKLNREPELLDLQVANVTQTNVTIYYSSSDIASAYYVISLSGSEAPDTQTFVRQGPAELDTLKSQFGLINIDKKLAGYIFIDNLTAETEYVFYILLMNRDLTFMEIPSTLSFKTENKHDAAVIELGFTQTYINAAEKGRIFAYLAFLMSLENHKVEEMAYNYDIQEVIEYGSLQPSGEGGYTVLRCNIIAVPTSDVYPSPSILAKRLLTRKADIKNEFPNYDKDSNIVIYDFLR